MTNTKHARPRPLGQLEQAVMDFVWSHSPTTAEACREALADSWPMKDSTVRTVLRRLELKGYVAHVVEGRTFIYRPAERRENVAARAVKHIIDRFCGGSAEQLLLGMVDSQVLDRREIERIAAKIKPQRKRGGKS
ncbi:MAG: BlaI/MecI/CopY family transcriptional regulator [Candidatus Acidiferrales bacterium]